MTRGKDGLAISQEIHQAENTSSGPVANAGRGILEDFHLPDDF